MARCHGRAPTGGTPRERTGQRQRALSFPRLSLKDGCKMWLVFYLCTFGELFFGGHFLVERAYALRGMCSSCQCKAVCAMCAGRVPRVRGAGGGDCADEYSLVTISLPPRPLSSWLKPERLRLVNRHFNFFYYTRLPLSALGGTLWGLAPAAVDMNHVS